MIKFLLSLLFKIFRLPNPNPNPNPNSLPQDPLYLIRKEKDQNLYINKEQYTHQYFCN